VTSSPWTGRRDPLTCAASGKRLPQRGPPTQGRVDATFQNGQAHCPDLPPAGGGNRAAALARLPRRSRGLSDSASAWHTPSGHDREAQSVLPLGATKRARTQRCRRRPAWTTDGRAARCAAELRVATASRQKQHPRGRTLTRKGPLEPLAWGLPQQAEPRATHV
jgi:hypothetical protein